MVSQALSALGELKAASSNLEASKLSAAKVASTASKTAEEKFKAFAGQLEAMGSKDSSTVQALQARKKLLESWVATQYEKTNHEIEKCESKFFETRSAFEAVVHEMVLSSYDQYVQQGILSKHQVPFQCDEEFLLELDTELEKEMNEGQTPEKAPKTPTVETPAVETQLVAICDKDPADGEARKPTAAGDLISQDQLYHTVSNSFLLYMLTIWVNILGCMQVISPTKFCFANVQTVSNACYCFN